MHMHTDILRNLVYKGVLTHRREQFELRVNAFAEINIFPQGAKCILRVTSFKVTAVILEINLVQEI